MDTHAIYAGAMSCILTLGAFGQDHHDHSNCNHAHHRPSESSSTAPADLKQQDGDNRLDLKGYVVLDGYYSYDDSDEGAVHIREELAGFGHGHEDDAHHHDAQSNGFNLRHVEFSLSAKVDDLFRSWATVAVGNENIEVEEAVIQTLALPGSFQLSAGKFPSALGLINHQHTHEFDFFDRPLVHNALFGNHGLVDRGVQLSWKAPTLQSAIFGIEMLNGENETSFQQLEADALPDRDGPRLFTAFAKFGPETSGTSLPQFGLSVATGRHQEAHDENNDQADDHWLDGRTNIYGADFLYQLGAGKDHGHEQWTVQAEYFYRERDLEVRQHDLDPAEIGKRRADSHDGYYLQALYGFAPKWRLGLRWDEVGMTNKSAFDGPTKEFDSSQRATASIDWRNSQYSLVRLHIAQGQYATEDGAEDTLEVALQWQVTFGN